MEALKEKFHPSHVDIDFDAGIQINVSGDEDGWIYPGLRPNFDSDYEDDREMFEKDIDRYNAAMNALLVAQNESGVCYFISIYKYKFIFVNLQ